MFEVEVARLFDQARPIHSTAPIAVLFAEASQSLLDRFAVFARGFVLRFRQEHALLKQWQDQGKLLFARGLLTQDAPCLLGEASPLPVPVKSRRAHHRRDLFVGVLRLPLAEFVQPVPQGSDGGIDDRSRAIEQPQGSGLRRIREAKLIA
jgi:hypothetical protein